MYKAMEGNNYSICGMQDFHSTWSYAIWGVSMVEELHEHLFPNEFEGRTIAKHKNSL